MTSNPIHSFFATPGNPGPFILRMTLAVIFFYHGMQKTLGWFGGEGWTHTLESWTMPDGINLPYAIAVIAILSELIVATLLFFGFFTRLAALGAILLTAGSIYFSTVPVTGFSDIEFPVLLLASGFGLLFIGGGVLSLDRALSAFLLPSIG